MMRAPLRCGLCIVLFAWVAVPASLAEDNWPQWRGPRHNGTSDSTGLPSVWSESENVLWKMPLPGPAGATPVIWGSHIFLTTVDGDEIKLLAASTDGKPLWEVKLSTGNRNVRDDEGNTAAPSPCTDGKHVWAFSASGELVCCDFAGQEVFRTNLQDRYGQFQIAFGMTSTPVLDGERLYFQLIHSGGAKVVCLEKATGNEVWAVERKSDAYEECEHSYASPTLYKDSKQAFLLTHGADYVIAHRLEDGTEIWRCGGLNPRGNYNPTLRFVATPATVPGLIVVPSAKNGPVLGLPPELQGDVSEELQTRLWTRGENTPDVPSPLIQDGLVYLSRESGGLICLDALSGEEYYSERTYLHRYRASPVYVDGKIILTARDGVFTVVQAGKEFKLLSENRLDDQFAASPAIAGNRIYLRGFGSLYAIGQK